jgi:hypothetical protein
MALITPSPNSLWINSLMVVRWTMGNSQRRSTREPVAIADGNTLCGGLPAATVDGLPAGQTGRPKPWPVGIALPIGSGSKAVARSSDWLAPFGYGLRRQASRLLGGNDFQVTASRGIGCPFGQHARWHDDGVCVAPRKNDAGCPRRRHLATGIPFSGSALSKAWRRLCSGWNQSSTIRLTARGAATPKRRHWKRRGACR